MSASLCSGVGVMRRRSVFFGTVGYCAVINYVHEIAKEAKLPAFDTVRGLFPEGDEIYAGARFHERTHTQIAVRNDACIKGFFLPRGEPSSLTSPVSAKR